jgi:hypothetical protein
LLFFVMEFARAGQRFITRAGERWRGILKALGGMRLSRIHFLPVGLVASKMSFNLFIKRSNPANIRQATGNYSELAQSA